MTRGTISADNADSDQAIFGLGIDEDDVTALGTQAEVDAHAADTSTHGVTTVAEAGDLTTHEADTSTHGVGTVADAADLTTHEDAPLASGIHDFKGIKKVLADGLDETAPVDEVKILTAGSAGLVGDSFTLTIGGNASGVITLPVGGIAALTAADIDTAMAAGALGYADADVVVTGSAGGPWTLTFAAANAGTDIGNMTVTDVTEAGDPGFIADPPVVTDDGTGSSVQGVAAVQDITIAGIAVGDSLADVVVYTTKAAIATQVVRPAADFTVGSGVITVADNHTDNTSNQYLVEFVDLT
jgi:hypothetical protein